MKSMNETMSKLAFLIESGMERASLVLAAQAITDKLQQMAETLAKIEASDVMPMMDSMKANFGDDVASRFEATVTAKLRDLTEALRTARDEIGNEILRMEASVNGTPVSDMDMDGGSDMTDNSDMAMDQGAEAPDEDTNPAMDPNVPIDPNAPMPEEGGDAGAPPMGDESSSKGEFDDLFKDAGIDGNSAGRPRKGSNESVSKSGANALRESANPDSLVVRKFIGAVGSGMTTPKAVKFVAEHFEIDADDVVDIVLESRK